LFCFGAGVDVKEDLIFGSYCVTGSIGVSLKNSALHLWDHCLLWLGDFLTLKDHETITQCKWKFIMIAVHYYQYNKKNEMMTAF